MSKAWHSFVVWWSDDLRSTGREIHDAKGINAQKLKRFLQHFYAHCSASWKKWNSNLGIETMRDFSSTRERHTLGKNLYEILLFTPLLSLSRLMVLRANCESFISCPQTIQLLRIEEKRKRMLRIFVLHLLSADAASIHSYVEHLSNGILATGRQNLILTSIQTYVVSNCCWAFIVHK